MEIGGPRRTCGRACAEPAVAGLFAAWALIAGGAGSALVAEEKIRVLIVNGQNNHNWRTMTPPTGVRWVSSTTVS